MLAAGLLTVAAVLGAPQASADPQDLVPYCSGDQTPMNSNCQYAPDQRGAHGRRARGQPRHCRSG